MRKVFDKVVAAVKDFVARVRDFVVKVFHVVFGA